MNAYLMNAFSLPASVSMPFSPKSQRVEPASLAGTFADTVADTLGGMMRWFAHGSASAVLPMQRTSLRQTQNAHKLVATSLVAESVRTSRPTRPVRHAGSQALRVVRLQEAGQPRSSVGRMVMSGRMADVCAELDRLVAREAALH